MSALLTTKMLKKGYILHFIAIWFAFDILSNTVLACLESCDLCSGNSQNCERCKDGFWLQNKECTSCRENCEQCTNLTHCSRCKAQFWDLRPYIACGSPCNANCETNGCDDVTGLCSGCSEGFYGSYCTHNCSLCVNGDCDLRICLKGCIDGYYKDAQRDFQCSICSYKCTYCNNSTTCLKCQKGFYLLSFENSVKRVCTQCLSFCEECTSYYNCTICKPGKHGETCTEYCNISNCHRCSSAVNCTECSNGYTLYNGTCAPKANTCPEFCSYGCDSSRNCISGCKDSFTGQMCAARCSNKCQKCDQYNGTNCYVCKENFYTNTCNIACSAHCLQVIDGKTCAISDGLCLNGCASGQWSGKCDKKCPESCKLCDQSDGVCNTCRREFYDKACQNRCSEHCVDDSSSSEICIKSSGKCIRGCLHGYTGDTCNETLLINTVDTSPDAGSTTTAERITEGLAASNQQNTAIIGVAAAGGALVIVIIVVMMFCVVRRQRKKGNVLQEEVRGEDKQLNVQMDAMTEPGEEYIYAQPNKPKTKSHHSKKEISEPQRVYDNVAIDLDADVDARQVTRDDRAESDDEITEETDVDAVLLENIDDEPSVIVTDVHIPTSDTYYNMAGLVRSRVQITKLLEYVKNKSDFENEFENLPQGLTRTCNDALKLQNRAKNRYNGIYAYDATRVVLQSKTFINANYIEGYSQSQVSYIASLGPTRSAMNNFETFWEMVWQEKANKTIMLTNLKENKKMKCEQYWPEQGNGAVFGNISLLCTAEKMYSHFVVRDFTLKKMSETREVTQYHYTAWPDKTVPSTVSSLIEFRDKVEEGETPVTGPMVVHCSAGIGRTGTYIALDTLIREGMEEDSIDIFGCVIALRGQRVKMVQNVEQYVFLHHCVLYALTCYPQSHPLTAVPHIMTDEKISTQYQAFVDIQLSRNRDVRPIIRTINRKENRKGADIPGEDNRVRLTLTKHDYINAVYVNGYKKKEQYIIAQTPLPNTVEDFVSMLYQERCPCVVCLDPENIKNKTVVSYIPPANKVSTFGRFQVECLSSDSRKDFTVRKLKISRIGSPPLKELPVRFYQFKGWDNSDSVPANFQPFLTIIRDVENNITRHQTEGPIVVHCVTGAERSGLFSVVSILLEKCTTEKELSVLNTVCQVRSRRQSAIPDIGQLRFCYDCVTEILEMSHADAYCNISNV